MNFKIIIVIFGIILSMIYSVQGGKMCTADYKPICGSNGQKYSNACQCENAQVNDKSLECNESNIPEGDQCSAA